MYFHCIANAALRKTHATERKPHILDISTESHCLDKPERSVPGICGRPSPLFRSRKRKSKLEMVNFCFLIDKKKFRARVGGSNIFLGNERTLSIDSAHSSVCNALLLKRARNADIQIKRTCNRKTYPTRCSE